MRRRTRAGHPPAAPADEPHPHALARCSSSRRASSSRSLKFMRKRTSSSGRRQFSVENAYTVSHCEPDVERAVDGVEQRLLARRVPVGALQSPLLRPPAVAVHHDRDVLRASVPGRASVTAADATRRNVVRALAADDRSGVRTLGRFDYAWLALAAACRGRRSSTRRPGGAAPASSSPSSRTRRARRGVEGRTSRPTPGDPTKLARAAADAGPRSRRVRRRRARHRGRRRRGRHRAPPRDRADRRGQRLRARARLRHEASARRVRRARQRRRPRRRPRPRQRPLVHVRHRVGLRRRGQPLGEHRAPPLGHDALRRRGAAHARRLQAAPVPAHGRRRGARAARRGSSRSATARRTPAGCTSRPTRASTTACSTSPSSARCRTPAVPRELPEGVQGHARRRTRRCSTFRGARVELESLDASVPMEVYADGERVGPLPGDDGSRARRAHACACRSRSVSPRAGARAGCGCRDRRPQRLGLVAASSAGR